MKSDTLFAVLVMMKSKTNMSDNSKEEIALEDISEFVSTIGVILHNFHFICSVSDRKNRQEDNLYNLDF